MERQAHQNSGDPVGPNRRRRFRHAAEGDLSGLGGDRLPNTTSGSSIVAACPGQRDLSRELQLPIVKIGCCGPDREKPRMSATL